MSKMRSFRFSKEKLELLKRIAERKHDNNQTQALFEAIDHYYKELYPPSVQGYIRIDRIHDINGEGECSGCEKSLSSEAWVAIYSDGTMKGVLCDECVEFGRA
jgi:hypothetical protein